MLHPHDPVTRDVIDFGPFRLSVAERLIERAGEPVPLGGRAMDVLIALVERAGDVVSQRELIDRVWPNVTVDDGSLRYHVSALRKSLGDGQGGARYVINVPGRGYCFVSPTTGPGPVATAHAMPSRPRRMVGRDAAVEAISAQLAASRFVTLVGPGGIGKTTVAVTVGHALATSYDSVCFADLGSLADPRLAPSLLAAALSLVVHSDDVIPSLVASLGDKRMLIILDSCEHVIETVSNLAEAIFERASGVHILATSREALRVKGEHVHRLAPLDCPPTGDALTPAEVLAYSAAQLFADRVYALPDADAPAVARICTKLDGIPLAIELAASRVEAYGVEGVDRLLDSRLSLLWQGRRTAPPRQQTLNATFDWSYQLLDEAEQATLRRLIPFAGAFSLEAAEFVASGAEVGASEIAEIMVSLVAKSLVASETHAGRARYRLLDTTRAYLHGKSAALGEADAAARRHAEFFRDLLERIGANAPAFSEARGFRAYSEHLGNVRTALEWAFSDCGDARLGISLAAAAAPLFLEMSLLTECRRWTERALNTRAATEDPRSEMELQASRGLSLMYTEGNGASVLEALTRALDLAERLGQLGAQLRLIGCLNQYHYRTGDFRGAVALAERALDVAREMADPTGLAVAEWMLGTSQHVAGNLKSALIHCRGALTPPIATARADFMHNGIDLRIRTLCALVGAQWGCGDADEAADTARYAVAEAAALEHPVSLSAALICAAFVFLQIGNLSDAEALIEQVISEAEKNSLAPFQAAALGLRGGLAIRRGEAAKAIPLLSDCLEIMRSRRHDVLVSLFARDFAQALVMTGRLDEALATIERVLSEVETVGASVDLPELLRLKGSLLLKMRSSNLAAAEDCFRRSLDLARAQGALIWELRTVATLARVRAYQGDRAEALHVLAPVYARVTQGFETADVRAARELLDALR
jgi:predicted ATPase